MPTPSRVVGITLGARHLVVPQRGLRHESFEYLRRGGKPVDSLPVTVAFYPDGSRKIIDGRHRILLAREAGKRNIHGKLLGYGPRGGVLWKYEGTFPI